MTQNSTTTETTTVVRLSSGTRNHLVNVHSGGKSVWTFCGSDARYSWEPAGAAANCKRCLKTQEAKRVEEAAK